MTRDREMYECAVGIREALLDISRAIYALRDLLREGIHLNFPPGSEMTMTTVNEDKEDNL